MLLEVKILIEVIQILILIIIFFPIFCYGLLYSIFGSVGSGKTSLEVYNALQYHEKYPDNKIFANFHLYNGNYPESKELLPNFVYTPYLIIPDSELHDCFIIADDYSNIDAYIEPLIKNMANKSRKLYMDAFLSGQDKTYIQAKIRRMSRYCIVSALSPDKQTHHLRFFVENDKYQWIYQFSKWIEGIVEKTKKYYDTYEVCNTATENRIIEQIKIHSHTIDDLDLNLESITGNSQKKMRLFNKLAKELGFC